MFSSRKRTHELSVAIINLIKDNTPESIDTAKSLLNFDGIKCYAFMSGIQALPLPITASKEIYWQ